MRRNLTSWVHFLGASVCSTATVIALSLALVLAPTGCGGDEKPETTTPSTQSTSSSSQPVSSKGKKWGGWRWKGKRDDCFFVYKNRCFDEKAEACSAAKCKKDACMTDSSAPAKVSCKR